MINNFITFGSHGKYRAMCKRLCKLAKKTGKIRHIKAFSAKNLMGDSQFWPKHKKFIISNKRGYGYWIWKPYLIKKTMEKMKDGEILLYLDGDVKLRPGCGLYLLYLVKKVREHKIIFSHTCKEIDWNKMDLINFIGMNNQEFLNESQCQATGIMIQVSEEMRSFINEWYDICCIYNLIDDTPSISKNFESFREHRHDQSIFSLLIKKHGYNNNVNIFNKSIAL